MIKTGRPKSPVKMVRRVISIPEELLIALKGHRGSKYDFISGYNGILTDAIRVALFIMDTANFENLVKLAKEYRQARSPGGLLVKAKDDTAGDKLRDRNEST